LERYNAGTILKIRLLRLTGSADIVLKDGFYSCGGGRNIFFIFDTIAGVIKKWIG